MRQRKREKKVPEFSLATESLPFIILPSFLPPFYSFSFSAFFLVVVVLLRRWRSFISGGTELQKSGDDARREEKY